MRRWRPINRTHRGQSVKLQATARGNEKVQLSLIAAEGR
jgi:hypothetical protein